MISKIIYLFSNTENRFVSMMNQTSSCHLLIEQSTVTHVICFLYVRQSVVSCVCLLYKWKWIILWGMYRYRNIFQSCMLVCSACIYIVNVRKWIIYRVSWEFGPSCTWHDQWTVCTKKYKTTSGIYAKKLYNYYKNILQFEVIENVLQILLFNSLNT